MTGMVYGRVQATASRSVCLLMLGVTCLSAQTSEASWSVTVKPTMNPLPIGSCGAVWLTLLDATRKETPRNPSGAYVTLADFDMSVASDDPRAVVGKYDGASSWSVCACQAATVGSSATITATYPAMSLAEKARVPGMKIVKSVPFTIKTRNGGYEPQGCEELKTATVIAAAGQPVSGGSPRAPATGPPPNSPLVGVAVPVASPRGVALPAGTAPSAPAAPPRGGAVAAAPLGGGNARAPAAGAPPTGVVIRGTAARSYVTWNPVTAPATYSVERWKEDAPDCCRNAVSGLTAVNWRDDAGLPRAGTYVYRVSANYADGTVGATTMNYVPPVPANPVIIQYSATGEVERFGVMALRWTGHASFYTLWGPGLPNTGIRIEGGRWDCVGHDCPPPPPGFDDIESRFDPAAKYYPVGNVPAGPVTFTLAAFYDPGHISTAASEFSTTTFTNVAPTPVNPSWFDAVQTGRGVVQLSWQPVSGVLYYRLRGPGVPNGDAKLMAGTTTFIAGPVPTGSQRWSVGSYYAPGPITKIDTMVPWHIPDPFSTNVVEFPSLQLTVTDPPPPPRPYTAPLSSDRFRVSILGFRATTAVTDDPSERDGRGNEVYVAVQLCHDDVGSQWGVICGLTKSSIHGDVSGFPNRVQAGSASATGGIKAGDMVGVGFTAVAQQSQTTFPFRVFEGVLGSGLGQERAIWIAPSLWEWNSSTATPPELRRWADGIESLVTGRAGLSAVRARDSALLGSQMTLVNLRPNGVCASQLQANEDRPIGMATVPLTSVPGLACNVIGLTRAMADSVLAGPGQGTLPPGIMRIDLVDVAGGQYAMYLKLERLP